MVTHKNAVILGPPETDTHIAVVDSRASDANAAVADAWKAYRPEANRTLKIATPRPVNGCSPCYSSDRSAPENVVALVGHSAFG